MLQGLLSSGIGRKKKKLSSDSEPNSTDKNKLSVEEQQNGEEKQHQIKNIDVEKKTMPTLKKKPLLKPKSDTKRPFDSASLNQRSEPTQPKNIDSLNSLTNQHGFKFNVPDHIEITPIKNLQLNVLISTADKNGKFSLSQKKLMALFSIKCRKQAKNLISYFLEKNLIEIYQEHDAKQGTPTVYIFKNF